MKNFILDLCIQVTEQYRQCKFRLKKFCPTDRQTVYPNYLCLGLLITIPYYFIVITSNSYTKVYTIIY